MYVAVRDGDHEGAVYDVDRATRCVIDLAVVDPHNSAVANG